MRIKDVKIPYGGLYYHYLPWYDKENIIFLDIARVLELVFRALQDQLAIVEKNLYLDTAMEALSIYQRDLGLSISPGSTEEERRKIIGGYLHYLHQQTTEAVVHDLVSSFCADPSYTELVKDKEVDTYKIALEIAFASRLDAAALVSTLDKVLPAHLAYFLKIVMRCVHTLTLKSADFKAYFPVIYCGERRCGTIPDDGDK